MAMFLLVAILFSVCVGAATIHPTTVTADKDTFVYPSIVSFITNLCMLLFDYVYFFSSLNSF